MIRSTQADELPYVANASNQVTACPASLKAYVDNFRGRWEVLIESANEGVGLFSLSQAGLDAQLHELLLHPFFSKFFRHVFMTYEPQIGSDDEFEKTVPSRLILQMSTPQVATVRDSDRNSILYNYNYTVADWVKFIEDKIYADDISKSRFRRIEINLSGANSGLFPNFLEALAIVSNKMWPEEAPPEDFIGDWQNQLRERLLKFLREE